MALGPDGRGNQRQVLDLSRPHVSFDCKGKGFAPFLLFGVGERANLMISLL